MPPSRGVEVDVCAARRIAIRAQALDGSARVVLETAAPRRRADRGPAEPLYDRKSSPLRVLGAWGDRSRLDEAMGPLARFLGAELVG